jgi:hypothetical protein
LAYLYRFSFAYLCSSGRRSKPAAAGGDGLGSGADYRPAHGGAPGTGDFDGDGNSDILFQNANGSIANWSMSGTTPTAEAIVQTVDPSWRAIGSHD